MQQVLRMKWLVVVGLANEAEFIVLQRLRVMHDQQREAGLCKQVTFQIEPRSQETQEIRETRSPILEFASLRYCT